MAEHRGFSEGHDDAAGLGERLELGHGLAHGYAAQVRAILRGNRLGGGLAAAEAAAGRPARRRITLGDAAIGEQDDVVLRLKVAGVKRGGIHHLEVELELLEQPAHVPRGHRAAVLVPQGDARLGERVGGAGWARRDGREVEAEVGRGLGEHGAGRRPGRDENHARAIGALVAAVADERHLFTRLEQAVDRDERVVVLVVDDVAHRAGRVGHLAGRRLDDGGDGLEGAVHAVEHAVELQPHLVRQRPARHVVGRNGRATGELEVVGVILRLEHVEQVRAERLRRLEDVRPGRVLLAAGREGRGGAVRGEAGLDHDVHELRRGEEVALAGRQHVGARIAPLGLAQQLVVLRRHGRGPAAGHGARVGGLELHVLGDLRLHRRHVPRRHGPRVGGALPDGVPAHHVDVVEQRLAVALREVEHRVVSGDRVVDRLAEVPRLRGDGRREVAAGQLPIGNEVDLHGRGVADGLGEQPDLVVEVRHRAQAAVPPRGVVGARPRGDAGLALLVEPRVHGRAHLVEHVHDQRVVHVVERIAEGRREHHRAGGPRLVVVVDDLREPLAVEHAADVLGLRLVHHVEVAVVVVPDVLLVEARNLTGAALFRFGVAHVPVGHQLHAIGVGVRGEDDHVAQDAQRLVIGLADELKDGLGELLGAQHLGGVEAAVDPDHGLALAGQGAGGVVGEAVGQRQLARNLPVAVELLEVLGRRDDGHQLITAFGRLADGLHHHAVGLGVELAQVLRELRVVGQHVIGADWVAEELLGRGDPGDRRPGLGLRRREGEEDGEDGERKQSGCGSHRGASVIDYSNAVHRKVQKGSERFGKVRKGSERFGKVLKGSERF